MIDSTTVTIAVTFQRNQLCTALLFPMYFTTSIHLAISILCQYRNKSVTNFGLPTTFEASTNVIIYRAC